MLDDSKYIDIAKAWASYSTCIICKSGAIAVNDKGIVVSYGIGGSRRGPTCQEMHCTWEENRGCTRARHAIRGMVLRAIASKCSLHGLVIYTTHNPCAECGELLDDLGVREIVYVDERVSCG